MNKKRSLNHYNDDLLLNSMQNLSISRKKTKQTNEIKFNFQKSNTFVTIKNNNKLESTINSVSNKKIKTLFQNTLFQNTLSLILVPSTLCIQFSPEEKCNFMAIIHQNRLDNNASKEMKSKKA